MGELRSKPSDADGIRRELEARPTSDLVSILRNRDEEEWRPEVFDIVASILAFRGVSPAEVAALGPEGVDVVEAQDLVTLGRYFIPVDAHAHRLALEAGGVRAWVTDESVGTMYGVGVGARLQVRAEDEAAARAILDSDPAAAPALAPESTAPPCPRCGKSEVEAAGEVQEPLPPSAGQSHAPRYECRSCGHSWEQD